MSIFARRARYAVLAAVAISLAGACSDVGDNTAAPSGSDGGDDATLGVDATAPLETGTQQPGDDTTTPAGDSVSQNPPTPDSSASDDVAQEQDSMNSMEQETSMLESGEPESGAPESGAPDTGIDATIEDSGPDGEIGDVGVDHSIIDAGPDSTVEPEAGVDAGHEAGPDASGGPDASPDAGHDAGGGGGLVPCTSAGQTGCVSCNGSSGGVCTADQAYFVEKDITQGKATAAGPDPAGSCYACLLSNFCIDSPSRHVSGVECGDFAGGSFTNGSGASVNATTVCHTLLEALTTPTGDSCVFGNAGVGNDTFCYCGTGGYGTGSSAGPTACSAAPASSLNGVDVAAELAGFASTAPGTNLNNYNSDATQPSAVANALAECARGVGTSLDTAACQSCFQ